MLIKVKSMNGEVLELEVQPETSVAEIHQMIEEQKGHPADSLKLICRGKHLQKDKTVEESKIQVGDTIVMMINKSNPKPATIPKADPKPITTTETEKKPEVPAQN
jgi:predicted house-cleaning NTP pyrophosphatase (Maf/HAM1 superfamily)